MTNFIGLTSLTYLMGSSLADQTPSFCLTSSLPYGLCVFLATAQASRSSLETKSPQDPIDLVNIGNSETMPLVVPGMQSKEGGSGNEKTADWMNKLMGKKIGEGNDETTFAKTDLPKQHRMVNEGDMMTMDHNPERLNIHTSDDGTVTKVTHG